MLTAIAEYFLEHPGQDIKWGKLFREQTVDISERFAALCKTKGDAWFDAFGDEQNFVKPWRDMLQHYVFRHKKSGEGPDLYLCLRVGEGELNLGIRT